MAAEKLVADGEQEGAAEVVCTASKTESREIRAITVKCSRANYHKRPYAVIVLTAVASRQIWSFDL